MFGFLVALLSVTFLPDFFDTSTVIFQILVSLTYIISEVYKIRNGKKK